MEIKKAVRTSVNLIMSVSGVSGSGKTYSALLLAAGLAGTVVAFIVRQVGLSWFDGGYEFGGAHAFFRIFAGFVWSIAGYLAAQIRDRRAGKSPPV